MNHRHGSHRVSRRLFEGIVQWQDSGFQTHRPGFDSSCPRHGRCSSMAEPLSCKQKTGVRFLPPAPVQVPTFINTGEQVMLASFNRQDTGRRTRLCGCESCRQYHPVPRAKESSRHPVEVERASASLVGTANPIRFGLVDPTRSDPGQRAGVVQWQNASLPNWRCEFDSRHPLQSQPP